MANILYGSSNVYRHFSRATETGLFSGRDLQLIKCTKKAMFDAHLLTVQDPSLIMTSVLENFIVDVCTGIQDDEVQLFAHQQITAHVEALFDCVTRFDKVNVIISPPLFRSAPVWFGSYLPDFHHFLISEVARLRSPRLAVCNPFLVLPSSLEPDGVHLLPQAGDSFLSHLDSQLRVMLIPIPLNSDVVPPPPGDRLDQILDVVSRTSARMDSLQRLGETVDGIASREQGRSVGASGTLFDSNHSRHQEKTLYGFINQASVPGMRFRRSTASHCGRLRQSSKGKRRPASCRGQVRLCVWSFDVSS